MWHLSGGNKKDGFVNLLSLGNLDDKLSLYHHNETLFTSLEKDDLAAELYTWKVEFLLSTFYIFFQQNIISVN